MSEVGEAVFLVLLRSTSASAILMLLAQPLARLERMAEANKAFSHFAW